MLTILKQYFKNEFGLSTIPNNIYNNNSNVYVVEDICTNTIMVVNVQ